MTAVDSKGPLSIVIVGHVDHGKSTFIGRFLYDTDNLTSDKMEDIKQTLESGGKKLEFAHVMDQFREEREQNITIDTAQTFFHLNQRHFVFVDAPGHKEYLKNMITGATQAENALLLLDVTEGIREQTDKHVQILKLLGINNLAVLINKMDTISFKKEKFESLESEVKKLLTSRNLSAQCIIPISATLGDNVATPSKETPWYKGKTTKEFLESLEGASVSTNGQTEVQFPVQAIHEVEGVSYVLGRVEGGTLKKGMTLSIFPLGKKSLVKSIKKYKSEPHSAAAGESVALLLENQEGITRGMVLSSNPKIPKPVQKFQTQVFWASPAGLNVNDELTVECRTQSVRCRVDRIQEALDEAPMDKLEGGGIGVVTFTTKEPLLVQNQGAHHPFSRVVFQQEGEVVGCGIVQTLL